MGKLATPDLLTDADFGSLGTLYRLRAAVALPETLSIFLWLLRQVACSSVYMPSLFGSSIAHAHAATNTQDQALDAISLPAIPLSSPHRSPRSHSHS